MMENSLDNSKKIFYLGPTGSYSEVAKNIFADYFKLNCEVISCNSISNLINCIANSNDHVLGVIPIENSIEGMVHETIDKLSTLANIRIKIFAETTVKIEHCLVGYATDKKEIKEVLSHPQALAQCRNFISENIFDEIKQIPCLSTSHAISTLSQTDKSKVAIGSEYCALKYNVPIIEKNINDEENNTTRFILLSKAKPYKAELSKISITFSTPNEPGALNKVLSVIEKYNLNMSQISSRPSRKFLGEYVFYIDFAGHIDDNNVSSAIQEILANVNKFEILSDGAIII